MTMSDDLASSIGVGDVALDKNENPYRSGYNRFFDVSMSKTKSSVATFLKVSEENLLICNGIWAAVDMCYRCFCVPGMDNVVIVGPTRGVYADLAQANNVDCRQVSLDGNGGLASDVVMESCDNFTKLVWLCSPNDPTGNLLDPEEILSLLESFDGIVVIDESYAVFSGKPSWKTAVLKYSNLVIINTFDYSISAANLNVGFLLADTNIINCLSRLQPLYTICPLVQTQLLSVISHYIDISRQNGSLIAERERLSMSISLLPFCKKVFRSDANFLLVDVDDVDSLYDYLISNGIYVRRVDVGCLNGISSAQYICLRFTVGTKSENTILLSALRKFK